MKRNVFLGTLIALMLCLSLTLCGSASPDGNISADETEFVELVVDAPDSLNHLESVYSLRAVKDILGNDGEEGNVELLYNANDEAEYILTTAEEGGYAIFHRMTGSLMEAGEFGASPYAGQTGKKYYFGPSNYAVEGLSGSKTDIMRGGEMTEAQLTAMHRYMAETRSLVVERSATKNYSSMLSSLQTASKEEQVAGNNSRNIVVNDWRLNPYFSRVEGQVFTEVEHPLFFKRMTNVGEFGFNSHGTCEFVATLLMLRYYDAFEAPGLLPNETIPQAWIDFCAGDNIPEIEYYGDINQLPIGHVGREPFSCEIQEGDSIYEAAHKFLIALEVQGMTATEDQPLKFPQDGDDVSVYNLTLPSCTVVTNNYQYYSANTETSVFNAVKNAIDNDDPISISIRYIEGGTTTNEDTNRSSGSEVEESLHAIVAYGYLDVNGARYYKTHFGWPNTSSIIVPSHFVSGGCNTLTVQDSHSTDSAKCENNFCEKKMFLPGVMECFAGNGHIVFPDQLSHRCWFCDEQHMHVGGGLLDYWQDYGTYDADESRYRMLQIYLDEGYDNGYHFCACEYCIEYIDGKNYYPKTTDWENQEENINKFITEFKAKELQMMIAPHRWGTESLTNGCCTTYCIDCGYVHSVSHGRGEVFSENGCCMTRCLCGYEYEIPHVGNFTYIGKRNFHITTCINCSATYQEQHAYALGIEGCILCGYGAPIGGGIIIKGAN